MTKRSNVLRGICYFYSETGTEGGYWAFQDGQFITKNMPRPYCKKCGKYLDSQQYENLKVTHVLPVTDEFLSGKKPSECPEGQHEREVGDSWSYEGLHILENGNRLTIFSPDNETQVVWSGMISLRQHPLFTETASGYWIHADQEGVNRETWAKYFLEGYPAELISIRKS